MNARAISIALRSLCAAALIALLMFGVDWHDLAGHFASLRWAPAFLAMLGLAAHFVVSPWKWQQSLRMHHLEFDLPYLIRANGIGFFLNNFLPSAIGGDAYRIFRTLPADGQKLRAFSAVVVERLVGVSALMALGAIGALFMIEDSAFARTYLALLICGCVVAVAVLFAVHAGWITRATERFRHHKVFEALRYNFDYLLHGGRRWPALIAISLLFQAIAIAIIYFVFQSLGVPASLPACMLICAASGLASILPISINGIGVVEGSFAGTAVALGLPYDTALAVALLIRLMALLPSLIFGALYVLRGDAPVGRTTTAVSA